MEFVQFYPLVLADKRLPSMILYPPFPEEVRLHDSSGEDILKKHALGSLNKAIHTKRDLFSILLFEEASMGGVYADFSNVPLSLWGEYPQTLLAKLKFPVRTKPVPISPAAHFLMGGIKIDEGARTTISGLFACGEVAWGLHGANRRGGNALTECLVMGKIAGRNAAQLSESKITMYKGKSDAIAIGKNDVSNDNAHFSNKTSFKELRRNIREIAWNNAGVVRSEKGLKEGLAAAEMRLKEDLLSASFVLKTILVASLGRKESRGSFQRKDFPYEDNLNWQKNSCLSCDPERRDFSLHYV
jgi:succinate dehydrogenase/fumarate reductase flavoprotein subunit